MPEESLRPKGKAPLRLRALPLAAALALLSLPSAEAKQYLTEEEALKKAFPAAKEFVREERSLTEAQRKEAETRLGKPVGETKRTVFVAKGEREGAEPLGYALFVDEVGKTLPITFLVAVDPSGAIAGFELVEFRESRGDGIARKSFREQFLGKTARDPLRLEKDIRSVTSSTMSSGAACLAARKALVLVETLYLNVPSSDGKPKEFRKTAYRMGTEVEIRVVHVDAAKAEHAMEQALARIGHVDNRMSHFQPESDVSRLNRARGAETVIDKETAQCIEMAEHWRRETNGAFDITIAPLVELWGFGAERRAPRVPSDQEIQAAMRRVCLQGLGIARGEPHLEPRFVRVSIRPSEASINLSGIAKGYAIDQAVAALRQGGIASALVRAGGDLFALGAPLSNEGGSIAIRHPRDREKTAAALAVSDRAVCTSGDAEKHFELDGKRYSHILDPRTGRPVPWQGSVTVVAPTAATANAMALALYVLGPKDGLKLLDDKPSLEESVAALWIEVLPDGTLKRTVSKKMKEHLVK